MANDLTTLRTKLAVSLRDPDMEVWSSGELDDLLTWSTARLYPRVARPMNVPLWPLESGIEDYELPTGMVEVSSVDVARVAGEDLLFKLSPGTWRTYGDPLVGTGKIHINQRYATANHYFVLNGYGYYDLTTEHPPDMFVTAILSHAEAEGLMRMFSTRARFAKWMALNQKENVTVNELSQMISLAQARADRELARLKTWRRPTPA